MWDGLVWELSEENAIKKRYNNGLIVAIATEKSPSFVLLFSSYQIRLNSHSICRGGAPVPAPSQSGRSHSVCAPENRGGIAPERIYG
ncbi:MAG: hypothetical protein F6J93_29160 [Oscillatoria sp. SIO1A7]|nr:hypothetical protein [Oscillatoria sp. SIO1A7]